MSNDIIKFARKSRFSVCDVTLAIQQQTEKNVIIRIYWDTFSCNTKYDFCCRDSVWQRNTICRDKKFMTIWYLVVIFIISHNLL